jgi:hypothetical protein
MKTKFILFLCFLSFYSFSQQIPTAPNKRNVEGKRVGDWVIWKDINLKETVKIHDVEYYRVIKFDTNGIPNDTVRGFYKSGHQQWKGILLYAEPDIFDGEIIRYLDNGKILNKVSYHAGIPDNLFYHDVSLLVPFVSDSLNYTTNVKQLNNDLKNSYFLNTQNLMEVLNIYIKLSLQNTLNYVKLELALSNLLKGINEFENAISLLKLLEQYQIVKSNLEIYLEVQVLLGDTYKLKGDFNDAGNTYLKILNLIGERHPKYSLIETKYNGLQYLRKNANSNKFVGMFESALSGDKLYEELQKKYQNNPLELNLQLFNHPLPSRRSMALLLSIDTKSAILREELNLKSYIEKYYPDKIKILQKKTELENKLRNIDDKSLERKLSKINSKLLPILLKYSLIKANDDFFKNHPNLTTRQFNLESLYNLLDDSTSVLEIVYSPSDLSPNESQYHAIILKKNEPNPIIIPLFKEKELMIYMSKDRSFKGIIRGPEIPSIKSGNLQEKFYDFFWKKIDKYFVDVKKIIYSPSGSFATLNFGAITYKDGKKSKYLDERFEIIQKISLLNTFNEIYFKPNNLFLVVGNVNFGSQQYPFRNLKNTKIEIDSLKNLSTKTIILEKNRAKESTFKKKLSLSPSVVHIASHAFYFPFDSLKNITNNYSRISSNKNPLSRSGLLFSKSNDYLNKTTEGDTDGVLTSSEIASMNTINTDLVVLSACQTGQGEVVGSEGV